MHATLTALSSQAARSAAPFSFRWTGAARLLACTALSVAVAACGGGGGGGTSSPVRQAAVGGTALVAGPNVIAVQVDGGTNGSSINSPFVTLTVCRPGTSTCESIDRVLVDTGSTGLRLAASALSTGMSNSLPPVTTPGGLPAGACGQFASGFAWGSVRTADVRMGADTAAGISIQLVDDPAAAFAQIPANCSGGRANIRSGLGAKGILGIGFLTRDCDAGASGVNPCTFSVAPGVYYGCAPGGCSPSLMAAASQVTNPVAALPVHNNGVVLVLPPVPQGGSAGLTGSLVLGIGTAGNNALDGQTVIPASSAGFITTVYNGTSFPDSFLDSGSNGLFFRDPALPSCGDFYCPSAPITANATIIGAGGSSVSVPLLVDNVAGLPAGTRAAQLGGDNTSASSFDFGLPFFFGRSVFVARNNAPTPYGTGPYWAF